MQLRKLGTAMAGLLFLGHSAFSQTVTVSVDAGQDKQLISPYIYGKNGNLSEDPSKPTSAKEFKKLQDAGLRFAREFGGNNGSKYNWRLKLTSHPDWYNNVYTHDWDFAAGELNDNLPGVQGMWAFQLTGFAAKSTDANFDDWAYNQSGWWDGVSQNLAGNGVAESAGGVKAKTEGDPMLYLEEWTADSTVGILDHWFGTGGLGYDKSNFLYWSMDNEAEIWDGTHDDVLPTNVTAEEYMQRYFEVAKKARAAFPEIKICGPVAANEWQWFAWANAKIDYKGTSYPWLEYFILRCAEEETATGIRLVDVVDIHFYPGEKENADLLQLHRAYFDEDYDYPSANGVKLTSPSGWDDNLKSDYIFKRIDQWLAKYMGADHTVGLGLSEFGMAHNSASVTAVEYASMLGTFADNGVELFSPWFWQVGMWETMHVFSRYGQEYSIQSTSTDEEMVSAYSSLNEAADSVTVILVNRSETATVSTSVTVENYNVPDGNHQILQLAELPKSETFVSHTNNALKAGHITAADGVFDMSLSPLSITAVVLSQTPLANTSVAVNEASVSAYPVPCGDLLTVSAVAEIVTLAVYTEFGELVMQSAIGTSIAQLNLSAFADGVYFLNVSTNNGVVVKRITKLESN